MLKPGYEFIVVEKEIKGYLRRSRKRADIGQPISYSRPS